MKKIILILVTGFGFLTGFAQQFPLQTQYQYNYSSINPAAVGEFDYFRLVASYRNQWSGFNTQEAIATQYLTVTRGFGSNGLGLTLLSDQTGGAISTSGLRVSYSHKVKYDTHELFLGLSGGGTQMNLSPINDPTILTNSDFVPEATFGAYVAIRDWRFGLSVPGILNANMEFSNSSENQITSHFYTMISYTKKLNDEWFFYPSLLIKNAERHQQVDANLNVRFKNRFWFGASYRTSPNEESKVREAFGPSFYVGIDLGRIFAIYSHDISSGNMSSYPTHEITLGYDFKPVEKIIKKEEKIQDSDNDGVVDSLDLCPNLFGSITANGCPDLDNDGVPDKYDLCPETPGSFSAGCPDLTDTEKEILKDVLKNLEFKNNSDRLQRSSYSTLSQLAVLLMQNPDMFLEINGYASSEGSTSDNLGLSARRSKSVEQFLMSRGVTRNSLITRFYGEESPIASNDSEYGRSKNRRVELDIIFHLKNKNQVTAIENAYAEALRGLNSSSGDSQLLEEEIVEEEIVEEQVIEEQVVEEEVIEEEVIEDEVIEEEVMEEEVIEEEVADEIIEPTVRGKYLLVVQVFSSKSNAVKYIDESSEDLDYIKDNRKYYVYVYSSDDRSAVSKYRSSYENSSWIKTSK